MTVDGIGWQRPISDEPGWRGNDDDHYVPWSLIGGVEYGLSGGKTPTATILALDGSPLGEIDGTFQTDRRASLAGLIVAFRPDLFVAAEGSPWSTGGCIRREVVESEAEAEAAAGSADDD
jgi:hypothetical protein